MTKRILLSAAVLAIAAACGKAAESTEQAAAEAPAPKNDAQRAADIAMALQVFPEKTDSVLKAYNMTADDLEKLMYKVAQDSALSAEYGRIMTR